MKSMLGTVLLTMAVSPAYVAARHSPLPMATPVAGNMTVSTASQAELLDTTASKGTADTTMKRPARPVIGRPAIQLKILEWINSPSWSSDMKFGDGHVYVIDFTAMWCGSCPGTYPIVTDLIKQYGGQGVRVLFVTAHYGIADDHSTMLNDDEEKAALPKYFSEHNVTEPVVVYKDFVALTKDYSDDGHSMALPKMVVVDGHGVVQEALTGWKAGAARKQIFATVAKLVQAPKQP